MLGGLSEGPGPEGVEVGGFVTRGEVVTELFKGKVEQRHSDLQASQVSGHFTPSVGSSAIPSETHREMRPVEDRNRYAIFRE
ncbi:hypothetical protein Pmi06nite_38800 [Planotetraspora mira]|uniref:Uncharacterized protein n=1 Tax=Planotetraspora mira TaxID=58121 RepID=A0A8J3XBE2_9ACTN|nr:hypothetical protein Pmi06nite_38800 [Planotetraspora mira]